MVGDMVGAVARWILPVGLGCALAFPVQAQDSGDLLFQGEGQSVSRATYLLRAGEYQEALAILAESAGSRSSSPALNGAYARALMEVGRYQEALQVIQDADGRAISVELENTLGEIHALVGRRDEAEEAFRMAMARGAVDRHTARVNLAVLLWNRGERGEATTLFDSFIDIYNGAGDDLTSADLMAVGIAVRNLGFSNPDLFQDALLAFDDAAAADPGDPLPEILVGELFLEKYRASDAREALKPVLERNPNHPRALLGQAKILNLEGAGGSVALTRQALEVNPSYVDAWAFLASLNLMTEDYRAAEEATERALETNPNHLEALSIQAAIRFLSGERAAYEEVRGRVEGLNPNYSDFFTTLAHHCEAQRRYQTAVDFAETAVEMDPSSWWSFGVLGMNQLRVGQVEEGRINLEKAFSGDPYNPWYMNTLDLLDTFQHFEKVTTEHFEIFLHESEVDLLKGPAAEVAEAAFSALRTRYGSEPPLPIRLEVYPNHADFSVRTLGIPGLGALGVSFGSTLVMDSPSAQELGTFNWASTMWHEIAHAFHLAISDHEVPRWFSEGLAVHEQQKAKTRWGYKASPAWLRAYQGGRLHSVSRLNQGFMRPEYPEQVVFSYYQASLVFDLIESQWGLNAIVAMMEGYGAGKSNAQVFNEVLGQTPEAFDEAFEEYVNERWGPRLDAVAAPEFDDGRPMVGDLEGLRLLALANPGKFQARLAYGRALFLENRFLQAEEEFRAAFRLYPEFGGLEGPLFYLAEIHEERGELERAGRALQQLGLLNETLYPVHRQEAAVWIQVGDQAAAARALEKALEVNPFDLSGHGELAALHEALGEHEGAVRERRAILALDPIDKAEAHYLLAAALVRTGERAEARTQVLRALEIAPTYEVALDLLLDLQGGGGVDGQTTGMELGKAGLR